MVKRFREMRVYRNAFRAARQLFELSKQGPRDGRYALTDQIRRSSRSVCVNIAEAWRHERQRLTERSGVKRRYPNHFISQLSDADAETAETRAWLDFALDCSYQTQGEYDELDAAYHQIIGGLVKMMTSPDRWCGPSHRVQEDEIFYDSDSSPTYPNSHTPNRPHLNTRMQAT